MFGTPYCEGSGRFPTWQTTNDLPGTTAAVGRRQHAQELERQWAQEERAMGVGIQTPISDMLLENDNKV